MIKRSTEAEAYSEPYQTSQDEAFCDGILIVSSMFDSVLNTLVWGDHLTLSDPIPDKKKKST